MWKDSGGYVWLFGFVLLLFQINLPQFHLDRSSSHSCIEMTEWYSDLIVYIMHKNIAEAIPMQQLSYLFLLW